MASATTTVPDNILATPMTDVLPPDLISSYLSSPPWQQVDGAFNFRCVSHPPLVRPGLIFRSGMLAFLTDQGIMDLKDSLGIKAIFDQRSNEEREKFPDPVIDGVQNIFTNISAAGKGMNDLKWTSLVDMFRFNLDMNREIYRKMFRFVLENPGQPFLVHCTAGKDRTSIATSLLLSVANVPSEAIAYDFALTRVGIEPAREMLQTKVMAGKQVNMSDEVLKAIAGCDALSMLQFLETMDEKYRNGPAGFVQDLGFNNDEIAQIRQNLRSDC